ncbi:MAG: glycosyl transferase [Candidatus Lloydbacteria bacterium RIFCSPHIGHO2_02_FULL_54_17]|uniref:Glycosyl transferase n=1 Tax=Candidatus Lloydbacteria bacterium RIFCSPHIGHO2_02_FULL_54_17 TaxID=1798664 RepID=A0A1G2DHC3_9BACT|nr:MAG: glycosyl transferase [Candidatus Lloydbacteria bacterium RIFCSPHIGHO2_01_FULL_54_11]OGZ13045.1 MAG: glycosyl transferase [Candidatus Lloydbacteria bacterium RIFCSPHIGHO2_02_FULL_54_17]OGZ13772.1 MAG: glycosyl transferase [Candidatus Lloydbacteria bacterium RIFCSPLOWO2_01_FULL_54_18]OGZ16970.1 MAG: glycosyl transferase [Candidatus Lloydbacteria bacterium RIFCSPLOWO2_02_FULL_54_12]
MQKISVITPVHNEEGNIAIFHKEVSAVLCSFAPESEIIAVDDGSTDGSWKVMCEIAGKDPHFKPIRFRAHSGQTAALMAGIHYAKGDVIVLIDGDLENDPADIPLLMNALESGPYDIVSGWRKERWKDKGLSRRLPSVIANKLISRITGLLLHDHGCTLKAYRRELFDGVELYGDMHRFVAAYLSWRGATVTEVPVRHRPRRFGASHYGISRTFRVLLDLVVIKFLNSYMTHPMRFFGGIGFLSFLGGLIAGGAAVVLKLLHLKDFVETPLPIFSALLLIVGVQMIVMGVLAEMLTRTYYESQGKRTYAIKEKVNLDVGDRK